LKIVTNFGTLMRLARAEADARSRFLDKPTTTSKLEFEAAKLKHDEYKRACLESDEMMY
jgi:hypothetical protein